ncbi:hypothetical protein PVAND_008235 [Polypedilum vanderplanki]|uniref:Uncharacterized protein n=1 Tax=Polypedilum vanderplanki TaxID=319348 RepID=A0A9J6C8U7_POLVA|nr:hypothetical protein PVAND_008235 [Polypedilum vanderplanki]
MNAATSMMPELGSKISLISKADIRYEGRLFTVDPQECTIALANVRSFGTEDRETPYPIAPQPTVYDYILFRGSDIKDIRVVNNVPIPNDPAIMQLQMPQQPQQGFPQNFPLQQQPGSGFGPFGQLTQQGPPQSGANIGGLPIGGGQNIPQQQQPPQQQQQQAQSLSPNQLQQTQANQQQQGNKNNNNLTNVGVGQTKKSNSRSGTPNARKSPISDMSVQTNQQRDQNAGGNKERYQRNNNQRNSNNNQQQHRERRDSGRNEIQNERREGGGGYRNQNQQRGPQMQRGGGSGYNNNHRNNLMRQGNQGSGRMRPPPQFFRQNQNKMMQQNGQQRGNKNQNTLKFDNEFDFEQANSKFEELRSQFTKLKVGTEENKQTPEQQVNGETEKKDDSGNETGADHEAECEDVSGYDKNKSFFDNISCEAVERSKGKPHRPDWRQERKINSETFGYSTNRRGNMRGRSYYRPTYNNRQMNNYRSGGSQQQNRNYNNRNRNNNSGRNTNNQVQASSQNQQQPVAATN